MEGAKSKKRAAEQSLHKSKSPKKAKTGKEGRSSKKAKKDGPQVKRASSAYIHFTTDFRKKLKEKCEKNGDPLPKANEVAKMAGEQWKKLTPDERGPYDQKAREDKERYMRECGKFEKKESDKPKRAPTAYFIFLAEFREQMKGKQSEGDQKIPALAGEKWRTMGEKEKEKYKQLEAAAKKKHEAAMEEWRKKNADKEPEKPVKAKPAPKKAPPKKTAPKVIDSEDDDDDDDEDDDDEEEEEEEADDADDDAGDDDDDDEDDDDDDDDDEAMTTAFPSTRSSLPPDVSAVIESYTQLLMDDCKVSCEAFNHEVSQKLWNARFDCADDATLEAVFGLHSILQKRWKAKPNDGAMLKCFVRSFGKECGVFLDTSGSCGDRFWIKKEGSGLVGVFAKFRNHDELLHPLLSEVFTAWKRDLDGSCNSGHVGGSSPSSRDYLDGMATAMRWLPRLLALPIVEEVQMQTTTTQTAGLIVVDPRVRAHGQEKQRSSYIKEQ